MKVDPRNDNLIVFINDELLSRDEAKISVFDSSVQGGDAVWEGLRVYDGKIAAFNEHLDRLQNSAKALAFESIPSSEDVANAVFKTLEANKMWDQSHIRLTLTRGEKITSGMNPKLNQSGCSLIVLAEWKPPVYGNDGIRLITSSIRRNTPECLDSKNVSGVDSAIMLDVNGFISETNDTNLFIVKDDEIFTPYANSCLPGITRKMILSIADNEGIANHEKDLSLTELYTSDEVFTSGTMGELTPVLEADGRIIGNGKVGELTKRMQSLHLKHAIENGTSLPFKKPD